MYESDPEIEVDQSRFQMLIPHYRVMSIDKTCNHSHPLIQKKEMRKFQVSTWKMLHL